LFGKLSFCFVGYENSTQITCALITELSFVVKGIDVNPVVL